jgi:hypothetical protein
MYIHISYNMHTYITFITLFILSYICAFRLALLTGMLAQGQGPINKSKPQLSTGKIYTHCYIFNDCL